MLDPSTTHITGLFPDLLGTGGVQEAGRLTSLAMAEIIESRGWSASLFGLNDPAGEQRLAIAGRSLPLQGFDRSKGRFIRAAMSAAGAARKYKTHIIFAAHPNLAPIAVWMQKASPRARAIVVAHGVEVWQRLPLVRRATLKAAHLVAAPSADTIARLVEIQGVSRGKTRLLPWPVSPDFVRFTERKDHPLPPGFPAEANARVVLTIGRAAANEQYKGTDNLIRAVSQLREAVPHLRLVAVGGGDDLPRLKALVTETKATDQVHFLQRLSREELASCYACAEIFAMPSAGEGFGIVFLEAMAFGKPLIAASAGGALDLVHDEVNGFLVPPRELAPLTAALARLLRDSALRESLGAKGLALVREKYSFAVFRRRLEQLFEECFSA